jgi:tetratricopeptide (TPR) repeat protein
VAAGLAGMRAAPEEGDFQPFPRPIYAGNNMHPDAPGFPDKRGAVIRLRDRAVTIEDAMELARRELGIGNVRAAAGLYDLIIAEVPEYAEAHNNRGFVLQGMRRHDDALASYDRAIAIRPNYPEAHLNRGNVLLALRRLDEALASFDRLIAFKPDSAAAFNARGIVLQEMKRPADALASYDRALTLQPDHPGALNNRGLVLREMGRHADALSGYDRAVALDPSNPTAHNNRGLTLQEMKRFEEALASFDRAVALKSDYAAAHNNRGITLQAMNRLDAALASFTRAAALSPDNAAAQKNLGIILKEMKRFDEAIATLARAIALNPGNAMAHYNLGLTLQEVTRYDEALACYDRAIALDPGCAEAYCARGAALAQVMLYDQALASCDKSLELKRDYAEAYHNRGVILVSKGEMSEAEGMFRKASALQPDYSLPWHGLSKIRKYRDANDPDVVAIRALLDKPDVSAADKVYLYFSLGKIYDDCKRYGDAFECYRQGNQICNSWISYDPDKVNGRTDAIIEVFTGDFLARRFPFSSESRSPLFIVGMPRSGTTLVASALSNHRRVGVAGELPTIGEFVQRLPKLFEEKTPYPRAARHLPPAAASRMIEDYEKRLRRDAGPDVAHVVDKSPLNFRHLGLIAMLFPDARVIHCTRDATDTCLSNYFQFFSLGYDCSFDLRNLGHFYGEYVRLMGHWREVLPMKIIEVAYEDMIADTEQTVRATLDALELEWDERCLAPHTNPSPVETPSNWQVRQPIYKQSVQRWRNYEEYLGPLKEALGRAKIRC